MRLSSALLALCLPLAESFAPTSPAFLGHGHGKVTGLHNAVRDRGSGGRGGCIAPFPAAGCKAVHLAAAGSSAVPVLESERLPSYTKIGKISVKGMNANLLVGPLFVLATFGWAAALYPAIALAYIFSRAFDAKRRRWEQAAPCWLTLIDSRNVDPRIPSPPCNLLRGHNACSVRVIVVHRDANRATCAMLASAVRRNASRMVLFDPLLSSLCTCFLFQAC